MVERSMEDIAERRAIRAQRRQKQRLENVRRAEKMHAARLVARQINRLPAEAVRPKGIHIGCSGWYYWHWKGSFYPADAPSSQWFSIYAKEFGTVELNAPFYSWPTIATVKMWLRQSQDNFIYTVKVSELITHVKRFENTHTLVEDFGYIADLLGAQMGCFLFQLPPSVRYSSETLHMILAQLDRVAVALRE